MRLGNCDDPRSLLLIAANPAARRAAALAVEDCEGKLLADMAPKLFETGIPQACAEVIRSGQARDLGRIQPGDKGIRGAVFAVKAYPLHDDCAVVFKEVGEHMQANEALQEYEKVVEATQTMIAVVNRDYRYLLTNRAFLEHHNLGREQVMGRSVSEVLGKEVFEEVIRKNLDACFQGEAIQYEMKYAYPEVGERNLLVSYIPIKGPAGFDRVASAIHDITEQRRAEEALKASEQRYRDLFENATDIVFACDLQGNFTSVNKAAERTSGYTRAELTRMNVLQVLGPEYVEEGRRVLEGLAASREPEIGEWEVVAKDGHRVRLEASLRLVRRNGELAEVQGIGRDITERKRAEEALRESETSFRAIFENAAIGIALVDMRGHPLESNPALQKMLGYNKTELAQMALTDYTHPDDAQASQDLFTELWKGKRDRYQLEKRFCRKDGQIVWGQLTASLVRNQNGEPQYVIGMVEDISERKRAEEALRELSARLLRLQDKERRRIARELHDTTAQSLAALAMNLSVVKGAASDLNPRARACLSESLELAEECSREIRTLSYLLHPPLLEEVGLGSALRWFVDGYTQRTGIHVDLEMPPKLPRLPEDVELALYRVVQEGLTNIHLHSESRKAHVGLKCRPDEVLLTVADEGRGLPAGLVEKGGRRGARLGVGIPGMRERIRQLGGQLEIVSGSNGTTLMVTVPLKEDRA